MVLPAEFESAAFHLGGERSIQLSYGSTFFNCKWVKAKTSNLRIVIQQGFNVIAFEFVTATKEIELDHK